MGNIALKKAFDLRLLVNTGPGPPLGQGPIGLMPQYSKTPLPDRSLQFSNAAGANMFTFGRIYTSWA